MLRSRVCTVQLERFSSGSGYPEINKGNDLPKIKIPLPNEYRTQEQIVTKSNEIL